MISFRFFVQVSRGIIRGHHVRRTVMFYDLLLVLLMSFLGTTFWWTWLREHPLFFLAYWFGCAWLTLIAASLAIYDMIQVRRQARLARRQLQGELLRVAPPDSFDDSHTH